MLQFSLDPFDVAQSKVLFLHVAHDDHDVLPGVQAFARGTIDLVQGQGGGSCPGTCQPSPDRMEELDIDCLVQLALVGAEPDRVAAGKVVLRVSEFVRLAPSFCIFLRFPGNMMAMPLWVWRSAPGPDAPAAGPVEDGADLVRQAGLFAHGIADPGGKGAAAEDVGGRFVASRSESRVRDAGMANMT